MISRRTLLAFIAAAGGTGLAGLPARATQSDKTEPTVAPVQLGEAEAFSREQLLDRARQLSNSKYRPPAQNSAGLDRPEL